MYDNIDIDIDNSNINLPNDTKPNVRPVYAKPTTDQIAQF